MNWIAGIILYFAFGLIVLVMTYACDNLSGSKRLNTPTKRMIFLLFWGIIAVVIILCIFPYIAYNVIKDGV